MNRHDLRERVIHGTPEFPVKIYNNHFDRQTPVLAPLHFHKEFEFCIVTEGSLIIQINENSFTLAEGEGVFINPESLHSITPAGNAESGFIAMLFDSGFICSENDAVRTKYISPLINGGISVLKKLSREECALVRDANHIYRGKVWGYELELKQCAIKLLSLRMKTATVKTETAPNKKRDVMKNTIDYIHKNYGTSVTLSDLAANVFVSPEYLCRIFSEMSDASPVEYLNRYRIMQSAGLLLSSDASISQISSDCGFNNSSYFNKMFMRFIGCTPTEYRKNHYK